jgi:2-dehydropantoate 2-reductase
LYQTEKVIGIEEKIKQYVSTDLFTRAEIPYQVELDMIRAMWLKFACNISENQSSAILGIPFGAWQVSAHANQVREMAFWEVIQV